MSGNNFPRRIHERSRTVRPPPTPITKLSSGHNVPERCVRRRYKRRRKMRPARQRSLRPCPYGKHRRRQNPPPGRNPVLRERRRRLFCGEGCCDGAKPYRADPHRRCVLQNDCGGHIGSLDGKVVKIVRRGDSENAEQKKSQQVASRERAVRQLLCASTEPARVWLEIVLPGFATGLAGRCFVAKLPRAIAPNSGCPVKAARPRVAEIPHKNAAVPIYR